MAENPDIDATTNDAEIDQLFVNKDGDLVIVESGFFDPDPSGLGQTGADFTGDEIGDPALEPRVITFDIADYDNPDSNSSGFGEVLAAGPAGTGFDDTDAYSVTVPIPISGAIDNDTEVTNTTKAAYDKSTGYIYIIDQDQDGLNFTEDLYVFDPATGTIVYSELSLGAGDNDQKPFNPGLFNEGTQIIFTRGDINGDGMVNGDDITELNAAIAAPTALLEEWYDLTSDGTINNDDLVELQSIIGTAAGDFDGDNDSDGADFLAWQRQFPTLDASDLADWQAAYGNPLAGLAAVPEPASLMLMLAGLMGVSLIRKR